MKISTLAAGVALSALMITGAVASDLNGSFKDAPIHDGPGVMDWSGWYVTGKLGVSKQDYDGSRHFDGVYGGAYRNDTKGKDGIAGNADDTKDPVRYENTTGALNWGGVTDFVAESDSNFEGTAEISRISRLNGLMLEPYVAFTMPFGNSKSDIVDYKYKAPLSVGTIPTGTSIPSEGQLQADKRFDASAGLKIGFVPISRVYAYAGAGLNWGFFNLKGHNDMVGPGSGGLYETSFSENDNALGYEVLLGVKYAMTSRVLLGVEGSWKEWNGLEGGATKTTDFATTATTGHFVRAGGRDEVDASEWAVKGTVTIKLSD